MDRKQRVREFIIPVFVILISIFNYTRLTGTENIRPIHIVTLITLGMGLGILLRNVVTYFRDGNKEE